MKFRRGMICTATFHLRLIVRLARTHRQDKGGVILASSSLGWRPHSDRWRLRGSQSVPADRRRPADRPPSINVHRNPVSYRLRPARRGKRAVGCSSRRRRHGQPLRASQGVEHRHLVSPTKPTNSFSPGPSACRISARSSRSTPVEVAESAATSRRGAPCAAIFIHTVDVAHQNYAFYSSWGLHIG